MKIEFILLYKFLNIIVGFMLKVIEMCKNLNKLELEIILDIIIDIY